MFHFFLLSFFFFSQISQWSHQSNLSWNCSCEIQCVPVDLSYLIWWRIANSVRKRKKKKWTIHKNLFYFFIFFRFVFPFIFSQLYQNNLNGTIPTQIGLMISLIQLWEEKKEEKWTIHKNLFYSFIIFSSCFSFT